MKVSDPLYQKQGIHVIASIFTIDKGKVKVLLIKRNNQPFQNMWALVGGALYNNETLLSGMQREITEKTGININHLYLSSLFDKVDRSPVMRMLAVTYIGLIDIEKVEVLKETLKTSDADWFEISNIPKLAYDHNDILNTSINTLKEQLIYTDILSSLFPNGFVLPEIQKAYESILGREFDRRNFRKRLLSLGIIKDTGRVESFAGKKPAKIYKFTGINKNVF